MYWVGLFILSIIWALGSIEFPAWIRYGGGFIIGTLYFVAFYVG